MHNSALISLGQKRNIVLGQRLLPRSPGRSGVNCDFRDYSRLVQDTQHLASLDLHAYPNRPSSLSPTRPLLFSKAFHSAPQRLTVKLFAHLCPLHMSLWLSLRLPFQLRWPRRCRSHHHSFLALHHSPLRCSIAHRLRRWDQEDSSMSHW